MLKILSVALLMILSCRAQAEDPPPVIIQSFTKMLPRLEHALADLKPGDLAVFDLDNTIFREVQTLGTDEWYLHTVQALEQKGLSRKEAQNLLVPVNLAIKTQTEMRLMEPGLPEFIQRLQQRGIFVIGLTARHPRLAPTTIDHLKRLGIDFTGSGFRVTEVPNPFLWSNGVAFTDGAHKGFVLTQLLEKSDVKPKYIFAIDDRIQHVHSLVEALLEMKIEGRVVHYMRVREEPEFDPAIADFQYQAFVRDGKIMSDAEARHLKSQPSPVCARQLTLAL